MTDSQGFSPELPARPAGAGFAIASLICGILGLLFSPCGIGIVPSLLGLVFGLIHMRQTKEQRALAIGGTVAASFGALISVAFVILAIFFVPMMQTAGGANTGVGSTTTEFAEWKGKPAPDFSVTTLDGKTLSLSELRGRRVIVDIWATWCPPCRMEIPHFNQLASEVGEDELAIIAISDEDEATVKTFIESTPMNYNVACSNTLPAPYGTISAYPTTFFIDRNGVIDAVIVGYHDFESLKEHATAEDFLAETL
jgi:peroxiredoxin